MSGTPSIDALRIEIASKNVQDLDDRQRLLCDLLLMADQAGTAAIFEQVIARVDELLRINAEQRAAGREEALQVLLGTNPDQWEGDEFIGNHPIADTGDYGQHWKEDKLRELFDLDASGVTHSLIDQLQGMYWSQMDTIQVITGQLNQARAALDPTLRFAGRFLDQHREAMGDVEVDGGTVQVWALQDGLLEERKVTEPCGDHCGCADAGVAFPTQCYFLSEIGLRAMDLVRPPSGREQAGEEPQPAAAASPADTVPMPREASDEMVYAYQLAVKSGKEATWFEAIKAGYRAIVKVCQR